MRPHIAELAAKLQPYRPELVCGPLVEGAFIGLLVAAELGCEFTYALRSAPAESMGLFPVQYRLQPVLGPAVRGRRVAIVNDVISAGSAMRDTYQDLRTHGAEIAAVGTLIVLGDEFSRFAAEQNLAIESLASIGESALDGVGMPVVPGRSAIGAAGKRLSRETTPLSSAEVV